MSLKTNEEVFIDFARIYKYLTEFFSVWAVEKELLIGRKQVFSEFASWKWNHNRYLLKKFADTEFEKLSDEFVINAAGMS